MLLRMLQKPAKSNEPQEREVEKRDNQQLPPALFKLLSAGGTQADRQAQVPASACKRCVYTLPSHVRRS